MNINNLYSSRITQAEYMLVFFTIAIINGVLMWKIWIPDSINNNSALTHIVVTMVCMPAIAIEKILHINSKSCYTVNSAVIDSVLPFALCAHVCLFKLQHFPTLVLTGVSLAVIVCFLFIYKLNKNNLTRISHFVVNTICLTCSISLLVLTGTRIGLISLYPVTPIQTQEILSQPSVTNNEWTEMTVSDRTKYLSEVYAFEADKLGLIDPPNMIYTTLTSAANGKVRA